MTKNPATTETQMPHELNASIQVARHYSLWATFRSTADAPAEAPKSEAEFVVNVDGSVWVSDWDALAAWRREYLGATHEQSD